MSLVNWECPYCGHDEFRWETLSTIEVRSKPDGIRAEWVEGARKRIPSCLECGWGDRYYNDN